MAVVMSRREQQLVKIKAVFARNVKTLRLRLGWTQAELAQRLGVSRATVNRIEVALHQPRFSEACLIADVLGVPISEMRIELWGGE